MRIKVVVAIRLVAILIAIGSATGLTLIARGIWHASERTSVILIVVGAAIALGQQVWDVVKNFRAPGKAEYAAALQRALTEAVANVAAQTGYSPLLIGISAFKVDGIPWWRKWQRSATPKLVRIGRLRLSEHPQPSRVSWTRGKGVIGRCWDQESPVYRDLRAAAAKHGSADMTEARFGRVSDELKMGMTRTDFQAMIGKYGEVLAVPIKDASGNFVGCVCVDAPIEVTPLEGPTKLDRTEVKQYLAVTAALVGGLLKRQ